MDTGIKRLLIAGLLLSLGACSGLLDEDEVGIKDLNTEGYTTAPGISDMNVDYGTGDAQKWWGGFYGAEHSWQGDPDKNCQFYGNCAGDDSLKRSSGDDCKFYGTCPDDAAAKEPEAPADNCGFWGSCSDDSGSGGLGW